ncbi:MAG TPA: glycosyltransferase family 1 protein [Ktedonobacterales bacterium]|nr:glycosyltransferase family 1 protein [Ktedonobacterales bacterium]
MRIAIVTENFLPKLDGVTRTLAMLLQHLQRHGHRVVVIGPQGSPRRYAGARVYGAPGVPLPFYPELRLLWPAPAFARRLARFRPDVMHVVDPMLLGAAGIAWAKRLDVPIVSTYHTNLAQYCTYFHLRLLEAPTWAYRRLLHNACALTLCPSPSTAHALVRQGFARVSTWPRGVDTELFRPERRSETWRTQVMGDPSRTLVLYAGRLSHEKNLAALVSAFKGLDDCETYLVVVGDGPARADVAQALAGRHVTFTGYLESEALARAYASADVFAFPSLSETFGQVVLEAMASGLPVVAFEAEGVRDLLTHGQTGLMTKAQDAGAFANALRALVASPEQRELLGKEAYRQARGRTWESVMRQITTVYGEVAEGARRLRAA